MYASLQVLHLSRDGWSHLLPFLKGFWSWGFFLWLPHEVLALLFLLHQRFLYSYERYSTIRRFHKIIMGVLQNRSSTIILWHGIFLAYLLVFPLQKLHSIAFKWRCLPILCVAYILLLQICRALL